MQQIKILFFIKNLGGGGAEKVLVNLLNRLDKTIFDITVHTIFDEGIYKESLHPAIHYKSSLKREFKGFVFLQKLFSPSFLHRFFIKEKYDIEVAFLEGVCTRVISGAATPDTKIISWLHTGPSNNDKILLKPYRSRKEMQSCYERFHQIFVVSEYAVSNLKRLVGEDVKTAVMYNVIEKDVIAKAAKQALPDDFRITNGVINFCSVGRLTPLKGFHRVIESLYKIKRKGHHLFHYYLIGSGEQYQELKNKVAEFGLDNQVTFLGFQKNPYAYMHQMDWFVCASYYEGFSSVVCESLIVDLPVITTECSGMKEILGNDNAYGIICENTDEALYESLLSVIENPSLQLHYKVKAAERVSFFDPATNADAIAKRFQEIVKNSI